MQKHVLNIPKVIGWSLALAASFAHAQDSDGSISRPYFFSTSCSSQGMWTQQALQMTNQIRQVSLQLKNDPNCQATSKAMQKSLLEMEESIRTAQAGGSAESQQITGKLNTLPQEIAALRSFLSDGSGASTKTGILKTMMKKAVEFSTLTAQVQAETGAQANAPGIGKSQSSLLLNFGKRTQAAAYDGIRIFNGVVETIAQNTQCLTAPQQGQFLTAAVSTLASFATSGQDQMGNQIAIAVSKLGALGREMKFSRIFKDLNKVEYMNSMSCLMELTAESYCTARDGQNLYMEMNKQLKKEAIQNSQDIRMGKDPSSPLAGYYILTQQMPLIANWLQKVQIGADPKLQTDANFKNMVLIKINNFFTAVYLLQGQYNERVTYIQSLQDPVAKKIKLIELVSALENGLVGGSAENVSSEFFTASTLPIKIPFKLLGIEIPPDFFSNNSTITFEKWIQNDSNFAAIPKSGNIDALAVTVGQNLDEIIQAAREAAIIYYNRLFIVDKATIYLDAMLGTNYTVLESLESIDRYLGGLQKRIADGNGNQGFITAITETRAKIGTIWRKFKAIEKFADRVKKAPRTITVDFLNEMRKVHSDFVKEVYDQLDVLLARSGWLSNRMARFVYYDYQMRLREGTDLSPYFKELYYATGFAAYDKMISMANGGPANVESDLRSALDASKKNISSLEGLFKENFVGMIGDQNLIATQTEKATAECKKLIPANMASMTEKQQLDIKGAVTHCWGKYAITPGTTYWDQHKRAFNEGYDSMPGESDNIITKYAAGMWTSFKGLFWDPITGSGSQGKYDLPGSGRALFNSNREKVSFDDEYKSSRYLTSRMCVQALAFNDLKSFWALCKDAVLASDFNLPLEQTQFKDMNPNYFQVIFKDKAYEDFDKGPGANLSKRICAFRDYFRRNQVLYLTMDMLPQKQTKYVPEYSIEEEDETVSQKQQSIPTKVPTLQNGLQKRSQQKGAPKNSELPPSVLDVLKEN